jgi:hypothetical protein
VSAPSSDSGTDGATRSAEQVHNDYNRVFETLVEDNTDLIGMIAYARYKATKQSWLRRRKAVDDARPQDNDYRTFVEAQLDGDNIQRLREEADRMLARYGNAVLESEEPEIREAALANHTLEQANATLTSVTRQNAWWRQLFVAALGAFAYSVLLAAIVVVLRLVGVDVLTVLANATN